MPPVVIENPVLNSPFREPTRHFRFDEEGITDRIDEGRRSSAFFIPIARIRTKGQKSLFDTEWTADRVQPNELVNQIRGRVGLWRSRGWPGVTATTRRLLEYWTRPDRENRLFFCQIEALETAIYITEAAHKEGDAWIANRLRDENDLANGGLPRVALKMATGTGKTVVMAMLIAWHALNKRANRQDDRFADAFLIVTPGITIRDRLRVLVPNDSENYYRKRDVLPPEDLAHLDGIPLVITNFHSFLPREKVTASKLTKEVLTQGRGASPFTESADEVARRVCRDLGNKKKILVLNDEAHHCYRRKPDDDEAAEEERLSREEKAEAERRDKDARVWLTGLLAVSAKMGIRCTYDLSATPFFLRGSGYAEGTLFPWVVSDFSLIDAIEAGIVKVPRVPVEDNQNPGGTPTYRNLWLSIRDKLPKKGRGTADVTPAAIPNELAGALHSLYGNYVKHRERWEASDARARGQTPPVFIVVCNNTNVSKLVFDWIAGYEKLGPDGQPALQPDGSPIAVPGNLDLFSNVVDGRFVHRPNTILVDSEELESGEGMSDDFKRIAAREIEDFRHEYRLRTGRDPEEITPEELMREVLNTVGKPGKLGEGVACVVSVSMLTEGWDANTVTHVLGVRAFGTQLLCEQVVGRALRRMNYPIGADVFPVEYAEVYGVPFSFIPTSGSQAVEKPGPAPTHVRALEARAGLEMNFPRVVGYRFEIADAPLEARFTPQSMLVLSTRRSATKVMNEPIVGEGSVHDLAPLHSRRLAEVAFRLAARLIETKFDGPPSEPARDRRPWLFPQALAISRRWIAECVTCHDDAFPQLLLLPEYAADAVERIYGAIVRGSQGPAILRPILHPYDPVGSTKWVDFDTVKPTYPTKTKSHVSHVVLDSGWEAKAAQTIEEMPEVLRYVKNQRLGFEIPYTVDGEERRYWPDFLVWIDDGRGAHDPLQLVVEVTGEAKKDKIAKVHAAKSLWVPALNNHGGYGRWSFVEITDPWNLATLLRAHLRDELLGVAAPAPAPTLEPV